MLQRAWYRRVPTSPSHLSIHALVIGGFIPLARQIRFVASSEYFKLHFATLAVEQNKIRRYLAFIQVVTYWLVESPARA